MTLRSIVRIDESLCDGCGLCVPACAEGAIRVIDGKARLVAENLCDGLGACLGDCPKGAITIEEREADAFDHVAVESHLHVSSGDGPVRPPSSAGHDHGHGGGCPGSRMISFEAPADAVSSASAGFSALRQWPIQLHLVSPTAPYFCGADVLLAADCVAFAMGDFHARYLTGKAIAIACPKLDSETDVYIAKLTAMIDEAKIDTLTVIMMEVPCCMGLLALAKEALARASRKVPIKKIVVGLRGDVLAQEWV